MAWVNDTIAGAVLLTGASGSAGPVSFVAGDLSLEAGEPVLDAGVSTAWYKWVAPQTGPAGFSTAGSTSPDDPTIAGLDTELEVFTASTSTPAMADLTLVTSNNDSGSYSPNSAVAFHAVSGTTYWVQVGIWDYQLAGQLELSWLSQAGQPNDAFANRIALSDGVEFSYLLVDTTREAGETGFWVPDVGTLWYEIDVPATSDDGLYGGVFESPGGGVDSSDGWIYSMTLSLTPGKAYIQLCEASSGSYYANVHQTADGSPASSIADLTDHALTFSSIPRAARMRFGYPVWVGPTVYVGPQLYVSLASAYAWDSVITLRLTGGVVDPAGPSGITYSDPSRGGRQTAQWAASGGSSTTDGSWGEETPSFGYQVPITSFPDSAAPLPFGGVRSEWLAAGVVDSSSLRVVSVNPGNPAQIAYALGAAVERIGGVHLVQLLDSWAPRVSGVPTPDGAANPQNFRDADSVAFPSVYRATAEVDGTTGPPALDGWIFLAYMADASISTYTFTGASVIDGHGHFTDGTLDGFGEYVVVDTPLFAAITPSDYRVLYWPTELPVGPTPPGPWDFSFGWGSQDFPPLYWDDTPPVGTSYVRFSKACVHARAEMHVPLASPWDPPSFTDPWGSGGAYDTQGIGYPATIPPDQGQRAENWAVFDPMDYLVVRGNAEPVPQWFARSRSAVTVPPGAVSARPARSTIPAGFYGLSSRWLPDVGYATDWTADDGRKWLAGDAPGYVPASSYVVSPDETLAFPALHFNGSWPQGTTTPKDWFNSDPATWADAAAMTFAMVATPRHGYSLFWALLESQLLSEASTIAVNDRIVAGLRLNHSMINLFLPTLAYSHSMSDVLSGSAKPVFFGLSLDPGNQLGHLLVLGHVRLSATFVLPAGVALVSGKWFLGRCSIPANPALPPDPRYMSTMTLYDLSMGEVAHNVHELAEIAARYDLVYGLT